MSENQSEDLVITSAAIDYVYNHTDNTQKYRNCHLVFENDNYLKSGRYQLKNPRISTCENFFEETVSHLENPEQVLGVARMQLTSAHKMNLVSKRMRNDLINSLFKSEKGFHSFIIIN